MPPSDPRLRPVLERALPGDDIPDSRPRQVHGPCEVLFGDGQWHPAQLESWRRDRHGRWVASLLWYAGGEAWTGSYIYESGKMRAFDGEHSDQ